MNRRKLLKGIGTAGLLGSLPVVQATPDNGGNGGGPDGEEPPNEMIETNLVGPGPFSTQTASTGEWIEYGFIFLAPNCESVNDSIFTERDFEVGIADDVIGYDETDQYWSGCQPYPDDDRVFLEWRYYGNPLPPGEYDMFINIRYNETEQTCVGGCETYEEGEVNTLENTLKVKPAGKSSQNKNEGNQG